MWMCLFFKTHCTLKVDAFRREQGACGEEGGGAQRFSLFVGGRERVSWKGMKFLGDTVSSGLWICECEVAVNTEVKACPFTEV